MGDYKRKRLFYLDFVRAIAVILILLTHYNAGFVFGINPPQLNKCVLFEYPFGIYIGDLGVSLFLIISGAALMYVYNERINLKTFYRKRFLAIYPMFWIAYIAAVLPKLSDFAGLGIPKWRFVLTLIGMDGYLSEYGSGFYVLGEWFLGFIVLFYIIFPLLRSLLKKNELVLWIIVLVLYVITLRFYNMEMSITKCIFIRLPELLFGMSFVKHEFKVKWYVIPFAAAVLIANIFIRPDFMSSIQTTYVGIAFFLILVFLSGYVEYKGITKICAFLTKYSYAIFLVHHVVISDIQEAFDIRNLSVVQSYILFAVSVVVILLISVILQNASDSIMERIRKRFGKSL